MSILKFLGLKTEEDVSEGAETQTVRKIAAELDRLEPEQARYLAAFAYILSRVAHADLKISEDETRTMEKIVVKIGGLPPEQAVMVVQMAKTQTKLFGATEDYLVTREFNRLASREQKLALLECLFAVSASDESISTIEDSAIRQIASELKLDHADFIRIRSIFREHLAVLKRTSDG
ncbi:MAG TPA: TerB family tellurite resistance protein [Acidobacteriota bacterium]|nr:TerB family tellurite resistance protein [Acidobacteriota bacterium]